MARRILLLTTGGTIASLPTEEGLAPGLAGAELAGLLPRGITDAYDLTIQDILHLDSSNIQPEEWQTIFKIKKNNQSLNKDIGIQAVHEKREIEEIPDGFNIVDGLPATVGHRHRYGLYSVYVTPHGVHYHRRKKCAGNHAHLTNLYLVYQKRKPCANCCQNHKPNMDFTWYEKYMTFQKENN